MTANQIPYDRLDWLQIAIYFLALPIVALLGASIGLLGRWRRGGMLWSTNVGLLGGAVACVILALGMSSFGSHGSPWPYAYFLNKYRWMMLTMTLFATPACALTAGVAWRFMHRPREKQPLNISISNVMLVQLFAMISLGSFVGLRLFMLQSSGDFHLAQVQSQMHGWGLTARGITLDNPSLSPEQNEAALSKSVLEEIAKVPTLEMAYFNLDGAWNVDLSPLLAHPKLNTMHIWVEKPTNAQLAQLTNSNLKSLSLDGDTSRLNFSLFASAKSLENLSLLGRTSRSNIEALAGTKLKSLGVANATVLGTGAPIQSWPSSIESLGIRNSNLRPADFAALANHANLKSLNIFNVVFTEKDLAFVPTLPKLESAMLTVDANSETWYAPLANLKEAKLWLNIQSDAFSERDAAQLSAFTRLEQLSLDLADHKDDIVDELCNVTSLEQLTINSPDLTEEALMKLVVLPKLQRLIIPPHLNTPPILKRFRDKRTELKLNSAPLVPQPRTPKPAPKKVQNKPQSTTP